MIRMYLKVQENLIHLIVVDNYSSLKIIYTRGVMVKSLDCRIIVHEFELHSRYYVHFWTNIFRKSMNPFILPSMG